MRFLRPFWIFVFCAAAALTWTFHEHAREKEHSKAQGDFDDTSLRDSPELNEAFRKIVENEKAAGAPRGIRLGNAPTAPSAPVDDLEMLRSFASKPREMEIYLRSVALDTRADFDRRLRILEQAAAEPNFPMSSLESVAKDVLITNPSTEIVDWSLEVLVRSGGPDRATQNLHEVFQRVNDPDQKTLLMNGCRHRLANCEALGEAGPRQPANEAPAAYGGGRDPEPSPSPVPVLDEAPQP